MAKTSSKTKPSPLAAEQAVEGLVRKPTRPKPFNGPMPRMRPEYDRIAQRVFKLEDPFAEYDQLERELMMEEALTPQALKKALNTSERNALRAERLHQNAILTAKLLELEMEPVRAAMRDAANHELLEMKKNKEFTKAIYDRDIDSMAAQMFPDEWREMTARHVRTEGMLKMMERLSSLWHDRNKTLGSMSR